MSDLIERYRKAIENNDIAPAEDFEPLLDEIERLQAKVEKLVDLQIAVEGDLPATLISGGLPRIKSALKALADLEPPCAS